MLASSSAGGSLTSQGPQTERRFAGIVAALADEARCLAPVRPLPGATVRLSDGSLLRLSGMGPARSADAACALLDQGAGALLSWGICGALNSGLRAGALVMPRAVTSVEGLVLSVDLPWWERLDRVLGDRAIDYIDGRLLSTEQPIAEVAEKGLAREATSAVAVDTESVAIAEVAAARKVPFLALRVVVDRADQALSMPVVAAIDPLGRPRIRLMVSALLAHPEHWLMVARIGFAYRATKRTLREVARTRPGSLAFCDVVSLRLR